MGATIFIDSLTAESNLGDRWVGQLIHTGTSDETGAGTYVDQGDRKQSEEKEKRIQHSHRYIRMLNEEIGKKSTRKQLRSLWILSAWDMGQVEAGYVAAVAIPPSLDFVDCGKSYFSPTPLGCSPYNESPSPSPS